jgi:uncharacterized protein
MPRASDVDIPACFEFYNNLEVFGEAFMARMWYLGFTSGMLGTIPSYASLCKDCGKSVERCPQHLPIPDLLKDIAQEMELWWFKPAAWTITRFLAKKGKGVIRKAGRVETSHYGHSMLS